eukprot:CAMPEP_0197434880 /NCGR_PEP_ID=MMETSP1175-20131217/2536_1 /TAXON_ID=1003142 /ORGANISM="Triceratium dubium, Strain CCMP147" /LENGTH=872 /DNA_ID=CAMNT_0042963739 /DNA_START=131 /DNA_END=2746 /DNA_ORIENTATION=+
MNSTSRSEEECNAIGSWVKTPYGVGEVEGYRTEDGIYEIILERRTKLYSASTFPTDRDVSEDVEVSVYDRPRGKDVIGLHLKTICGAGKVVDYRDEDNVYTVDVGFALVFMYVPTEEKLSILEPSTHIQSVDKCPRGRDSIGLSVATVCGVGTVKDYRSEDNIYVVDVGFALLYMYTSPEEKLNILEPPTPVQVQSSRKKKTSMELNAAYEALEKMRRMNLEMECFERGVAVNYDKCSVCLLEEEDIVRFPRLQRLVDETPKVPNLLGDGIKGGMVEGGGPARFQRMQKLFDESPKVTNLLGGRLGGITKEWDSARFPRMQKIVDESQKMTTFLGGSRRGNLTTGDDAARSPRRLQKLVGESQRISSLLGGNKKVEMSSEGESASESCSSGSSLRFSRIQGLVRSAKVRTFEKESMTETRSPSLPKETSSTASHSPAEDKIPTKEKTVVLPRIQKMLDKRQEAMTSPCLICASPSCSKHSSANFRKSNITLCHSCEKLFERNFVNCILAVGSAERANHIDHMVDLYDRSLLLLRYSSQYIDSVAEALENSKEQQNKIGLGSSGAGVVSGVLGVAAAATIFTPAGPPLFVASLLFGGGATAVQTGSEAINYFSEPKKIADRVIALHGMVLSILRVTSALRDAMVQEGTHIEGHGYDGNGKKPSVSVPKAGLIAGANVGRSISLGGAALGAETVVGATAAAEAGVIGARAGTALSRAGTAAARTVRFARFAGGALSAAVLVMEANSITNTLKQIQAGSPCEKATNLRKIRDGLDELPSTESLDSECQHYLQLLSERRSSPAEQSTTQMVQMPIGNAESRQVPEMMTTEEDTSDDEEFCEQGATIVDGENDDAHASTESKERAFDISHSASQDTW